MATRRVHRNPVIQESNVPVYQPMMEAKKSFWDKTGPIMAGLLVVAAFLLGSMWSKISFLEKGGTPTTGGTPQAGTVGTQPEAVKVSLAQIKDLFGKNVIKFGKANAKNLFVEFSDPSCPYCHIAGGLNPELNSQVGAQFKLVSDGGSYVAPVEEMRKLVDSGNAGFVWIYTPGHGSGELATKAMYCAFDEGKFWPVHDILMTNTAYDFINNTAKNDLANADKMIEFVKPAISSAKFSDCLKSDKYKDRLATDTTLAGTFGVQGTPGFFVNEVRFGGAYNWNDMKSAVK